MRRCGPRTDAGVGEEDKRRWRIIYAALGISAIATVADVVGSYEVPAELYPFAGLVIGAALARIGGVREVERPRDR